MTPMRPEPYECAWCFDDCAEEFIFDMTIAPTLPCVSPSDPTVGYQWLPSCPACRAQYVELLEARASEIFSRPRRDRS